MIIMILDERDKSKRYSTYVYLELFDNAMDNTISYWKCGFESAKLLFKVIRHNPLKVLAHISPSFLFCHFMLNRTQLNSFKLLMWIPVWYCKFIVLCKWIIIYCMSEWIEWYLLQQKKTLFVCLSACFQTRLANNS